MTSLWKNLARKIDKLKGIFNPTIRTSNLEWTARRVSRNIICHDLSMLLKDEVREGETRAGIFIAKLNQEMEIECEPDAVDITRIYTRVSWKHEDVYFIVNISNSYSFTYYYALNRSNYFEVDFEPENSTREELKKFLKFLVVARFMEEE